eukprot:CAMPEP_0177726806 /NCGR_PEP_ID=MMETSP0484_2-20121128/19977_1 /TAXON_ID=354590 /ORGANISM="Rhodomonas lens, Strain RHODO" /LENGTH=469 /DNA_ID=CAMNT_0019239403 /DNA_START=20 /DNA_END=1429 /DNA_ORIENTATION=-
MHQEGGDNREGGGDNRGDNGDRREIRDERDERDERDNRDSRDSRGEMPPHNGKLFIGGVSWDTTEHDLHTYFSVFGELADVVVMKDKATGKPKGFGFITYEDPRTSEVVARGSHEIHGRLLDVNIAQPKNPQQRKPDTAYEGRAPEKCKRIFVGGLPSSVTDVEMREYFSKFGKVEDARVCYDQLTHNSRGFGFVTFEAWETVETLVYMQNNNNPHVFDGKTVEVKKKIERPHNEAPPPAAQWQPGYGSGMGAPPSYPPQAVGGGQFPIRPGMTDCAFYMKTGTCSYAPNCKFNHPPERIAGGGYGAPPPAAPQDYWGGRSGAPSYSGAPAYPPPAPAYSAPPAYPPAAYGGYGGGAAAAADSDNRAAWAEYYRQQGQAPAPAPAPAPIPAPAPAAAVPAPAAGGGSAPRFPVRPGMTDCAFYLKTGNCSYGESCKFNHPPPGTASYAPPGYGAAARAPRADARYHPYQ